MNKNSLLLYIIIFLIIILIIYGYYVFYKSKDMFQVIFPVKRHECNFYPWGPSEQSCKTNCLSNQRIGLWDSDGKQCSSQICEEICSLCKNESDCQWISSWDKFKKEKLLGEENDSVLNTLVPKKLQISGISYLDSASRGMSDAGSNIKIMWANNADAKSFMIHFYNMRNQNNMIKIENIVNSDKEEHILTGLEQGGRYAIILYGINDYGISRGSNIIEVNT